MDSKPFFELLKDDVPLKWTKEHEKLFQNIKDRISEETIPAVPNPMYPFHIHVDSSSISTGYYLVQEFLNRKRIVSFNSRVFRKDEQKMTTLHRKVCGIITALQIYEHLIIDSPHPIKILLWSQATVVPVGTKKKIISPFLPKLSDHYSIH